MDEIKVLLQAIETLRPDLPAFVGAEWPEFEAQLNAYLKQLEQSPERSPILRAQILALFGRHRQAHQRLVELMARFQEETSRSVRGLERGIRSTSAPASSEDKLEIPWGITNAYYLPQPAVFHFALNGEHVRGPAILVGAEAMLSFNYGVPGPSALQSFSSAPLDAARLADTDIVLDVSTTGSIVLKGERHGTAKFRDGRMQEPVEFTLVADAAGAGHIHVAFSVKGETVHQSDVDVLVVASQPELDCVPLPDSGAATVLEALAEEIAGVAPPPEQRIKLSLSYDGGKFCIDLEDLNNGETDFVDRFVSQDIDKSKLDTLLKAVREELAPSYASADFWRVFDGNSAAAAAPAARRALRRTLETVASAGWKLYSQVESDAKIAEALQYVETNGRIGATLTIDTDDIFLPWEIVYGAFYSRNMTERQKQERPLQPARFWGARFAIETLQRGGNVSLGKLRAAHRQAAAKVSVSLNPTIVLDKVEDEAQPLALLRKWGKQLSDDGYLEDIHDECGRIRRVLQEAAVEAKILYVYCHGGAPSPTTGASEFLQLDADCELRPGDLDPKVRFNSAPIIVLNACQAGAISPVTLSNFLREFRERGALGLISATGSIPILFGERFGEELVQGCLDRKGNLASAVLALRQEHVLNRGNAVPLLYSVQCQI